MKVLKFKNPKHFNLEVLKEFGSRYFEEYENNDGENVPPLSITINELNVFKITDLPARKMLYIHFVEAVSPMIIYSGEEYEKLKSISKEEIYDKAFDILNNMSESEFSELFSLKLQKGMSMKREEYEKIEIESDFTCFVPPFLFYEKPKVPILPPQKPI